MKFSKNRLYFIGFTAIIISTIQQIIYFSYEFIVYLGYIADVIIMVCAILIRFYFINPEETADFLNQTDILNDKSNKKLKPNRFIDSMFLAMIVGTIASITIHYNFIIGVFFYLIMQIIHIYAFSGIIHYAPKLVFTNKAGSVKKPAIISTIGFIMFIPILYVTMIIPTWGLYSLFVLPYVLVLVLMTLITYWGLGYINRPLRFRIMLCLGASFFLFSDLMIGYSVFDPFYLAPLLIYPTWILAIFFMQLAVLELIPKEV
ncbi:MAG: lysoplasmalogenase family protein [Candidatus Hermodarchaeota archaeon]